jgi:hypothetical protein
MKAIKLLLLSFSLMLFACEDKVDLNLPDGDAKLVVDGMFSNEDSSVIVLSMSTPYFKDGQTPRVSGAQVMITSNDSDTLLLNEDQQNAGNYITHVPGVVGKEYTLHITLATGEQFTSISERMNRIPPIDSIYYLDKDEVDEPFLEDGFVVLIDTQEPEGLGDYYRWTFELNGVPQSEPEHLFYAEDELVDGNYISEIAVAYELVPGDEVVVRQLSITQRAFNFLSILQQQIDVGGPFDAPPAPVKGNVFNNNSKKNDALGFFNVSGVSKASIVIR